MQISLHQFSETPVMSRWNSFNSSHSLASAPKSITEWLELWEKDPVEILLDLGFGTEEPDICTKIPSRFISNASVAKGINIRVFLEAQKQRMDIEKPNLYGRFRQLKVLDHVTSAFSSLLNGINTQQQKSEESNGEEKSMTDIERDKVEATRTKRRRLGHLLRKASRQKTILQRTAQASGNSDSFKDREEQSPTYAEMDRRTAIRTGFSENSTLVGLTEEQSSTEDDALTLSQAPTGKSQVYSYIPIKDRPRKESNLLLTHMLRRVSGLKGKPPDSFEMEEHLLIFILACYLNLFLPSPTFLPAEVLVTRTNSCQSDSSGFLEEPPEPLPLQIDMFNISCSCETGTPETQWQVSQVQNKNKVISSSSLQVANFSAYCRSEFSSQESTETCCLGKISEATKLEKNDSVQNAEIHPNPSKSVTVQMSSRLVSTVQKVSLSEALGKGQSLEIKSIGSQCSEGEPRITSELGILKESLKKTREASIQTDTIGIKTRNQHGHLTKSVSLDTGLYGKYRSSYHETLGAQSAQCGHSCHCVCCHHCCFQWAFPFTASSKHLGACCSNHSTIELQLLKTLELLQDTTCTIHEIEAMKSSCQSFREKLDEIEQHLIEQQDLFSSAMSDEGREKKKQLQVLRQAVRRELSELEFQLNDRSRQAREGILMVCCIRTILVKHREKESIFVITYSQIWTLASKIWLPPPKKLECFGALWSPQNLPWGPQDPNSLSLTTKRNKPFPFPSSKCSLPGFLERYTEASSVNLNRGIPPSLFPVLENKYFPLHPEGMQSQASKSNTHRFPPDFFLPPIPW
uniref:ITPR interacting domain containing 1 n=1 Tax=Gopherus evgoodei TaxID=1825980 RepID=A0A8C4W6Z0_9SAUR